jgi:hypothetical protein
MIDPKIRERLDHLRQREYKDLEPCDSYEEWHSRWERKVEVGMAIVILLFGALLVINIVWR